MLDSDCLTLREANFQNLQLDESGVGAHSFTGEPKGGFGGGAWHVRAEVWKRLALGSSRRWNKLNYDAHSCESTRRDDYDGSVLLVYDKDTAAAVQGSTRIPMRRWLYLHSYWMYTQHGEITYGLSPGGILTIRAVYFTVLRHSYLVLRVLAEFPGFDI